MVNDTNHQDNLEYIQELLSSYLDGEVTDEERTLVEQAIETSPKLRQELEILRQTVAMVKALPPMPAPRPFTLSEADVQPVSPAPKKSFWLSGWAGGLALLATAVICVVVAGGIFLSTQLDQSNLAPAELARSDQAIAPSAAEAEMDEAGAAEPALEQAVEDEAGAAETRQEAAEAAPSTELEAEKEAEPAQSADPLAKEDTIITEAEEEAAGEMADDSAENVGQTEAFEAQEEAAERDADVVGSAGGEGVTGAAQATALPSPPAATPTPFSQPTSSPEALAAAPAAPAEEAEGESLAEAEEPAAESALTGGEDTAATEEEALADAEAPTAPAEEPPVAQSAPASEDAADTVEEEAPAAGPQEEQSQPSQDGNVRPEETVVPPTMTLPPAPSPTPQPTIAPLATPTTLARSTLVPPTDIVSTFRSNSGGFILGAILIVLLAVLVIAGIVIWWVINKKS